MTKPDTIHADAYVFCLPAPPPRQPYLIYTVGDTDDADGFRASIVIHERRDLGSHLGECIALVPKDATEADMEKMVEGMIAELLGIDDDPVRMAEQVEDAMNPGRHGETNDGYTLAWEPALFDSDGPRYTLPDMYTRVTDADEIALLRGFMKRVAAKLRTMPTNADAPPNTSDDPRDAYDPFPLDSKES